MDEQTINDAVSAVTSPSGVLVAGVAILGIVILMRTTRRRAAKSRATVSEPVRDQYARLTQESRAGRSLETVMEEMDELSRQIHGRLDTKIAKITALIRDADERIAQLSRMQRQGLDAPRSFDVTLDSEAPVELAESRASGVAHDGEDDNATGFSSHNPRDPLLVRIYALADRAWSAEQIATEVSRPVGEVELVLSLRRTSGSRI